MHKIVRRKEVEKMRLIDADATIKDIKNQAEFLRSIATEIGLIKNANEMEIVIW